MDSGILLESGTNELELLEFVVGDSHFGINVAKIQELLPYTQVTPVPNVHPYVEGIFMPRDEVISVIDLAKALNIKVNKTSTKKDMLIVTNFNQMHTSFHVQEIAGINRISWTDIATPDETISSKGSGVATGVVHLNDKLVIILDFEKIVTLINPETGLKASDIDMLGERKRNEASILIAEDSQMLLQMLKDCLVKAGYTNLTLTENGAIAWAKLQEMGGADCVITDIEMPQMDGHRLTKLIKDSAKYDQIPVVIFSSLVNEEMKIKGESLGADAQLSKPEIGDLVKELDKLLQK